MASTVTAPVVLPEAQPGTTPRGSEVEITLGVLNAIQENSALTQRTIALQLGIALGLANAYLKRCLRKGLIKVAHVPRKRYAYYLTPKGFAEKSRLTRDYLSTSFNFFRFAREQCSLALGQCASRGWQRVAFAGTGDLGEIAVVCARDYPITPVGFIDNCADRTSFSGLPVAVAVAQFGTIDAILITDVINPQSVYDELSLQMAAERIFTPSLLNVSRTRPPLAE